MKIITIIVLSALALAAAALLSSGCADSLIMGDDFHFSKLLTLLNNCCAIYGTVLSLGFIHYYK